MSTALMLGVFVLSALVGGGAAGLMLAFTQSDAPRTETASTEGVSIITPVVKARRTADAAASSDATAGRAVLPKSAQAPAATKPAGATVAGKAEAVKRRRTTAAEPDAKTAGVTGADATGSAELARLTNQVVAALSAMNGAEAASNDTVPDAAATNAERLRQTLAELVSAAQAQGKSDAEINRLVAEALDSAGEENIPAILRDASGKVNVRRLLASVMPARRKDVMPTDSEGLAYFRQLEEEASVTSTEDRPGNATRGKAGARRATTGKRRASGRFFVQNGKRYTIIRKGDTLSDIAYAAYGDVLAYPAILRANRGRISVRNLKPGTRILIPDIRKTTRRQKARTRRKSATGARRKPVKALRPATDRIITLPASGVGLGTAGDQKPVKVRNFRSTREAQPLPITPQGASR